MRRKCTNVGGVEYVRQLNGISGGRRDAQLVGRDEFTTHIVRESRNDCEGSGQHARAVVLNTNEEMRRWCTC